MSFAFIPFDEYRERERIHAAINRQKEIESKLLNGMSPAAKAFSKQVEIHVHAILKKTDNRAAEIIRSIFDQYHLKSHDEVESVEEAVRINYKQENSALTLILGIAGVSLTRGGYHERQGKLSPTGVQMLDIWRACSDSLVVAGVASAKENNALEEELLRAYPNRLHFQSCSDTIHFLK